jgi:hypothetical protein
MSSWATVNTDSGFVGIGTAANSINCLTLYTSSSSSSNQTLITSTSNFANIQFNNDFSCNAYIGIGCTNISGNYSCNLFLQADSSIVFNTGGNIFSTTIPSMIIFANGNVGIGSSRPNTKLDVSGVINITNGVNSAPSFSSAYGGTGDRIVFFAGTSGSVYPYSIGINTSSFWYSVPTNATHDFYVNGVAIAQINSSGLVTNGIFSITSGSSITCKSLSLTDGDIGSVKNITSSGVISTSSNIIINNSATMALIFNNALNNSKIRLFGDTGGYSFGVNTNILRYDVPTAASHIFNVNNNAILTIASTGITATNLTTGNINTTNGGTITSTGNLILDLNDIQTVRNIFSTGVISTTSNIIIGNSATMSLIFNNVTNNSKIQLFGIGGGYSFGVNTLILRYDVPVNASHVFNVNNTAVLTITNTGITTSNLTLGTNDILTVRNITSTGLITTTGNITTTSTGSITSATTITAGGNITTANGNITTTGTGSISSASNI